MNTQVKKLYLLIIILFTVNCLYAQTDQLFWFVASEVNDEHGNLGEPTHFRLTNTDTINSAIVTITQPSPLGGMAPIQVTIPANSTETITFERGAYNPATNLYDLDSIENYLRTVPEFAGDIGNKSYKGLRIEATERITAYYEIDCNLNREIMALKGRNALGKEFFVPFETEYQTYSGYNVIYSAIDIVATDNNTQVTITPTNDMMVIINGAQTQHAAFTDFVITLDIGETFCAVPYDVDGDNDNWPFDITRRQNRKLGGTKIISTKAIAVNTKDDLINSGSGIDLVADQLVPVTIVNNEGVSIPIVGNDYVVVKNTAFTNADEYAYIIATDDNTDIWVDGAFETTLNAGVQYPLQIIANTVITSPDSAFYVYHVSGVNYGATSAQFGGAIMPSVTTCTGSYKVSFVRSSSNPFYMNILVRVGGEDDFVVRSASGTITLNPLDFSVVIPGEWSAASIGFTTGQVPVGSVTTIENLGPNLFHLGILNGYTDCFYGYFSDFNPMNVQGNVGGTINTDHKTCYGERVELVAYGADTYFWKADKEPSFLADPTAQRPVIYPTEDRRYTVIGYGDCNMSDSTQINVYVADPIIADFAIDNVIGCSPLDIMIENNSRDDWPVWKYQWYYGDGSNLIGDSTTAAAADTLYHTYTNTSDTLQNLKFTLVTENDFFCKDTLETDVVVKPEIHAGFTPNILIGCNPLPVSFTDNSTGNLDKYRWVFGDGAISNVEGDTSHTYSHFNTNDTVEYNVELRLTSPFFCRDTARATISVFPYLEAGFAITEDDGCHPLAVTFTNTSSGEDSISLDYGDGTSLDGATFGTVEHTYTNTGTTVLTRFVELKVFNDEGCEKVWLDTITVYPEVRANYTIDGPGIYTGCNSRTVTFTNTSNNGTHTASQYFWTFGDGSNLDTTFVSFDHFYNNTYNDDHDYDFTLHAESQYGCSDDTSNTITIYRADANFTVDNVEGCSVLPVNITNTSIGASIPVTGWSWDYDDGSPLNTNEQPGTHLHNYTNTTNPGADQTFDLSLTVTRNASCSDIKTTTITVSPAVDVSFITTPAVLTICDSVEVDFNSSLAIDVPGTTYEWDFGDGTSSDQADPSHVYRNITNPIAVDYTARVTATTPNGCTDTETTVVTVRPYVNAKFTVDKVQGCSPLTVDAIATEYIGIPVGNYAWTYGDGYNPAVSDPPAHTYPANPPGANDIYTLRLDVSDPSGNCTDFATKTITVFDEALADFNPKNSIDCNPYILTFDNLSLNAATYKWDFDDGGTTSSDFEPTYTFTNNTAGPEIYNVELEVTSDEGCTDVFISPVNVYSLVIADFDIDISEDCSPVIVTISNNSSGGTYRWFWDDDDLTAAADYTTNTSPGSFTHTYTNSSGVTEINNLTLIADNGNGCYDTLQRAVTVHTTIDAQFTVDPVSEEGCNPLTVDFTNTTFNGDTYNWSFGDGSSTTTESPTHEFINTLTSDKTFNVRMDAESVNGCTDYAETVITVYSKVIADFSIETSEGCPPFSTSIDNTSIGNVSNSYEWQIDGVLVGGSPTDLSDFDHTYDNNNAISILPYEVKLIATNPHGCTSEHIDTVTVYEYVEASYSMDIDNGCTPLNIIFTDLSSVPASTKYTWDFGDGASSGLSDPTHTFYNPSRTADLTYTIDLTVQSPNYCSDDTSMVIDVYHQPLATMYVPTTTSCPPLEAYMDNFNSKGYDSFEWRFGDGNTNTVDNSLVHSYTSLPDAVKYYDLILWVGTDEGCTHTDSIRLSVFPDVIADFSYDVAGCSPFTSTFTNESSATAEFFSWNFDDGTTSSQQHPIHRFENTTNVDKVYNVRLFARNEYECSDDTIQPVTVYAQPTALFNPTPAVQTYPEATVWLNSTSNNEPWDYLWEFGDIDGTTSFNSNQLLFDYEHWGEKDIKLTLTSKTSDCSDNLTKSVIIYPPAVNAAFTTNIDGGCLNEGLEVLFTAAGSAYAEFYNYTWDFGDGETGTGQNINHTYEVAGVYYVKMTASSNEGAGEDFEYKTIRVYSNPDANFEVSPKLVMLNTDLEARVEFFNMSECNDTAGCAYVWHFGDGNTSISRDVTHNYSPDPDDVPIKYDVSLYVTTAHGCTDSLILLKEVEIIGAGEIAFPNAFTPNDDGLNDTFRPVSEGVIEYELLVYNRWGELIFTTKDLSAGWNGKINSEYAKPDVYVWKAMGKFTNGRSFELAGDITLIR
ncbi:MAG: PKD domain-containing protein [Bacteroidales bacterium]|nr:PKD domain-containing protein [Bacteroidales bacterium]